MDTAPFISIIIPVYNVEDYIARCLDSCVHQTFGDIEIVVVDDCGSDNSMSIVQQYARQDLRISTIYHSKNLGTFHARKTGILNARGQYCMFADPDDYFTLDACEIAYKTIVTHKTDMAHFAMTYKPRSYRIKPIVHTGKLEGDRMRSFLSCGNNLQGLCDKIYDKSVLRRALEKLEFIEPPFKLYEDGFLVLVASLESRSYFGVKHCIYYYCHNPNSITKTKTTQVLQVKQKQTDKLLQELQHLYLIYPQYTDILLRYQYKIASSLMMESRDFDNMFGIYESMQILHKYNFTRTCDMPPYLKAMVLSLRYAFRWQNLIRICVFCISFGRVKI